MLSRIEEDLQVRGGGVRPHDVEVDLHELPIPSALRVLPAPDLCRVPAPEGEAQLRDMRRHEPGEGNGEVESHRNVPAAVIGEPVDLFVGLTAALAEEHLGELEHGRVDRREPEAREDLLEGAHDSRRCASLSGRKSRKPLGMRGSMRSFMSGEPFRK